MLSFADAVQMLGEARETGVPIWEVTRQGLAPSYFVGTVHTVRVSDLGWIQELGGALRRTNITAIERTSEDRRGFAARIAHGVFGKGLSALGGAMGYIRDKGRRLLGSNFNTKAGEELSWAAALWISNESGGNWTPEAVHESQETMSVNDVLATMASFAMGRYIDEHPGLEVEDESDLLDFRIEASAKAAGHEVVALETETSWSVDGVVSKIAKIPDQDERKALAIIRGMAMTGGTMETPIEAYLAGHMRQAMRVSGYSGNSLLSTRNKSFWSGVKPLLDAGAALIAVGIGHISGSTGLIEQATKAGFKVRQVAAGELSGVAA